MLSLLTQHEQIYFPNLTQFKDCCLQCDSNQRKELSWLTPQWSIFPFNNWNLWMFTQTSWCVFTQLCQCHLELERVLKPSFFCFGYFSFSKNFNYIARNANIFHLKSSGSGRPSYFLTSTPLRHTAHHHNRSTIGGRLLTWNFFDI
jgi:hypothetical protein